MLFLVVLILALGWAGWLWAWGRDRVSTSYGFAPTMSGASLSERVGMPQTAAMARLRRRDLLVSLVAAAFISFLFARSWASLWIVHGAIDITLVGYAMAVAAHEQRNPRMVTTMSRPVSQAAGVASPFLTTPRMTLQPVAYD